jgi:transcriptional regulator with XRE-family HTH domain
MLTVVCRTIGIDGIGFDFMKKRILIQFGQKVREERLKQGLSQEEFAAKAGVHRTYIGMIERAEKNITLENIEKIASALKLNIYDLFKVF